MARVGAASSEHRAYDDREWLEADLVGAGEARPELDGGNPPHGGDGMFLLVIGSIAAIEITAMLLWLLGVLA